MILPQAWFSPNARGDSSRVRLDKFSSTKSAIKIFNKSFSCFVQFKFLIISSRQMFSILFVSRFEGFLHKFFYWIIGWFGWWKTESKVEYWFSFASINWNNKQTMSSCVIKRLELWLWGLTPAYFNYEKSTHIHVTCWLLVFTSEMVFQIDAPLNWMWINCFLTKT